MYSNKSKALVIEDDSATRHALVDLIASTGLDVDAAADGETAVEFLDAKRYDVVILDLILPKMSGTDIMERLASLQPQTLANTIVVTGLDVREIRKLFPSVHDALAKPVIPSRLMRAVRTCIDQPRTA